MREITRPIRFESTRKCLHMAVFCLSRQTEIGQKQPLTNGSNRPPRSLGVQPPILNFIPERHFDMWLLLGCKRRVLGTQRYEYPISVLCYRQGFCRDTFTDCCFELFTSIAFSRLAPERLWGDSQLTDKHLT